MFFYRRIYVLNELEILQSTFGGKCWSKYGKRFDTFCQGTEFWKGKKQKKTNKKKTVDTQDDINASSNEQTNSEEEILHKLVFCIKEMTVIFSYFYFCTKEIVLIFSFGGFSKSLILIGIIIPPLFTLLNV